MGSSSRRSSRWSRRPHGEGHEGRPDERGDAEPARGCASRTRPPARRLLHLEHEPIPLPDGSSSPGSSRRSRSSSKRPLRGALASPSTRRSRRSTSCCPRWRSSTPGSRTGRSRSSTPSPTTRRAAAWSRRHTDPLHEVDLRLGGCVFRATARSSGPAPAAPSSAAADSAGLAGQHRRRLGTALRPGHRPARCDHRDGAGGGGRHVHRHVRRLGSDRTIRS